MHSESTRSLSSITTGWLGGGHAAGGTHPDNKTAPHIKVRREKCFIVSLGQFSLSWDVFENSCPVIPVWRMFSSFYRSGTGATKKYSREIRIKCGTRARQRIFVLAAENTNWGGKVKMDKFLRRGCDFLQFHPSGVISPYYLDIYYLLFNCISCIVHWELFNFPRLLSMTVGERNIWIVLALLLLGCRVAWRSFSC